MNKLRKKRDRANLTMEQLAVKAGVTRQTLENIELEKSKPNLATLEAIAEALDCSVRSLIDD